MAQMVVRGYERWLLTGEEDVRDLMKEYHTKARLPNSYPPVRLLLINFIKHIQQRTLEEIMEPNSGYNRMTCSAEMKKVGEDWVNNHGKEEFKVHETKGKFDEGYIRGFVYDQLEGKWMEKYQSEWFSNHKQEKDQYKKDMKKATKLDQPNRWIDIAVELNQASVKCHDQALMVMGQTGGPCTKCFSIWHATNNHNRKNCKRCGKTGHWSRECENVKEISSEEDLMHALENPDKSC